MPLSNPKLDQACQKRYRTIARTENPRSSLHQIKKHKPARKVHICGIAFSAQYPKRAISEGGGSTNPELKVIVSRWVAGDRNIQPPTAKVQKGKQRAKMKICNMRWMVQGDDWAVSFSPTEPKIPLL